MKMTEVITKLREVNPVVQKKSAELGAAATRGKDLALDAANCATPEGRKSLVDALLVANMQTKILCDELVRALADLDAVEKSYTRKFEGGGSTSASVPGPDQPDLPGVEWAPIAVKSTPDGGVQWTTTEPATSGTSDPSSQTQLYGVN